jgi:glycosyltransferase involved in cell wall biosynthesis
MNASAVEQALCREAERSLPARARLRRTLFAIVLDPSQKFGSLEEQIFLQAKAFGEQGSLFLPLFLTPSPVDRVVPEFREACLPVECLDLDRFRWSLLRRLLRVVSENRIEVIHWNFTPPLSNPYVWALTLFCPSVRHFFTDHNSRTDSAYRRVSRVRKAAKRALLKRYAKVICVSEFVRSCLEAQGGWSNLSSCLHFINTDRFRPDAEARLAVRQRFGAADQFVLLIVANLIREKGVDVALRALPRLPKDLILWVVGGGVEAKSLQALSRELGVCRRVSFLGPQAHVEPFMQGADCLVCPSRWAEAAGLVNVEALAAGLPVVASRIGGIPEYVEDGRTGLLFPPEDSEVLAAQVLRLHGDPMFRQTLALQARSAALERFSAHARLDDFLAVYRTPEPTT